MQLWKHTQMQKQGKNQLVVLLVLLVFVMLMSTSVKKAPSLLLLRRSDTNTPSRCIEAPIIRETVPENNKNQRVDLSNCNFHSESELPSWLFKMKIKELDLSGNKFTRLSSLFMNSIGLIDNLEILFLTNNQLVEMPNLSLLKRLTRLSLKQNRLKLLNCDFLPGGIVHLILTDNEFHQVSTSCTEKLQQVKKLMCSRNLFTYEIFEHKLKNLASLQLLRLSQNRMEQLPMNFFYQSPQLKWISLGVNPLFPLNRATKNVNLAPLARNDCLQKLGQGTSGTVYRCGDGNVIKLFQPTSSDGSSDYEMYILSKLLANKPENPAKSLLFPKALITDGKNAAVFPLIEGTNAARPPDIYTVVDDQSPTTPSSNVLKNLNGIIKELRIALVQLHNMEIIHGDVYAHNVLLSKKNKEGEEETATLVDYGASTSVAHLGEEEKRVLKIFDWRAFDVLVRDFKKFYSSSKNNNK